jgi:hypothetical protein
MKVKTSELTGMQLDYAVSLIEGDVEHGVDDWREQRRYVVNTNNEYVFHYSQSWVQMGPIIESELIQLRYDYAEGFWIATKDDGEKYTEVEGTTPLIAAARCYVASKLGDEVEIPEELI